MKKSLLVLAILLTPCFTQAEIIDELANGSLSSTDMSMVTNLDLNEVQEAFNDSEPTANIKTVAYSPNVTYKIRTRVFMGTMILLPKGEKIRTWDLADSVNFSFVPKNKEGLEHIFTIQPINYGADTNLIILGESGNLYSFYIRADSTQSEYLPDFAFHILNDKITNPPEEHTLLDERTLSSEIAHPNTKIDESEKKQGSSSMEKKVATKTANGEYLRGLPPVKPGEFDYRYKAVGDGELDPPVLIFSNGYWTWFKLTNDLNLDKVKVPVVYEVVDGYDQLVNTRVDGSSIIAETVSDKWTLRLGEAYVCIRKDK